MTAEVGVVSPDHAWRFFPASTRQYKVTVTPLEPWNVAIHLLSSYCAPNHGCYGASNKASASGAETLTFQGVAGVEYVIVIDGVENQTASGGPLATRSGYYTISVE